MTIKTEISLEDFEAWSGARDTLDTLNEKGLTEQLENILDDEAVSGEEGWTDTSLNDFLWFETDTIAEWLGFNDWEELENGESKEDEEREEEIKNLLNECLREHKDFNDFCAESDCDLCPFKDVGTCATDCMKAYKDMLN